MFRSLRAKYKNKDILKKIDYISYKFGVEKIKSMLALGETYAQSYQININFI